MAENNNGNKGKRASVVSRWGERRKATFFTPTPRKPFKGEAQFTLDDLYITPFTHELTADELGRTGYTPLERDMSPSGVNVLDEYLQALSEGRSDIGDFCARHNAKTADLDGLVFLLTGMSNVDFRKRWIVRCADELLRYTDMEVAEVARRCGAGSRGNLYFIYERELNCSPSQRRTELRKPGDLGKYKIVAPPKG